MEPAPAALLGDKSDGSSLLGSQSTPSGQRARFAFFSTLLIFFQLLSREISGLKKTSTYLWGVCVCVAAIKTKCELFFFLFPPVHQPLASHLFGSSWQSLIKCSECALRQQCESSLMPADLTRTNLTSAICGWASAKFRPCRENTIRENRRFIKTSTPWKNFKEWTVWAASQLFSAFIFVTFLLCGKTHTPKKEGRNSNNFVVRVEIRKSLLVRVSCLLPEAISSASFNYSFRHHTRIITSITAHPFSLFPPL
jgi:hypothetical protein